mmetsp:Transcript_24391/g.69933  ORF Transcript_24391/g.69933 Transcript_24391/m.69933 type:complete len:123 (+) Transcript_24391:713-1081(+)
MVDEADGEWGPVESSSGSAGRTRSSATHHGLQHLVSGAYLGEAAAGAPGEQLRGFAEVVSTLAARLRHCHGTFKSPWAESWWTVTIHWCLLTPHKWIQTPSGRLKSTGAAALQGLSGGMVGP